MSRPKSILAVIGAVSVRVEYVKTRRVLRFSSGSSMAEPARATDRAEGPARRADSLELTLAEFRQGLGIDGPDLGSPSVYLLFAGRRVWAAGGTRDLLGTWGSETEARAAFRRCREERGWQWAELAAVDAGGECRRLSWFGMDRPRKGQDIHAVRELDPHPHAARGLRRLLRGSRPSTATRPPTDPAPWAPSDERFGEVEPTDREA